MPQPSGWVTWESQGGTNGVAAWPKRRSASQHRQEVAGLPPLHRDPFDRLLVAQSRFLDIPLLTDDEQVAAYDVATISPH